MAVHITHIKPGEVASVMGQILAREDRHTGHALDAGLMFALGASA